MKCCPTCGYYIPDKHFRYEREGVRLTPLQAHLYDVVKRAGSTGIAFSDLYDFVYHDNPDPPTNHALYVAVVNANNRFRKAGRRTRIYGTLGAGAVYRVGDVGDVIPRRNGRDKVRA